jgi:hypothetical protein
MNDKELKKLEKEICSCSYFQSKEIVGAEILHNKKCKFKKYEFRKKTKNN